MIKATNSAIKPKRGSMWIIGIAQANDVAVCPDGKEEPNGRLISNGTFLWMSQGLCRENRDLNRKLLAQAHRHNAMTM